MRKSIKDDIELVERFWDWSNGRRRQSPQGYRSWMLNHAKKLYKLMLDGLAKRIEDEDDYRESMKAIRSGRSIPLQKVLREYGRLPKAQQQRQSKTSSALPDSVKRKAAGRTNIK